MELFLLVALGLIYVAISSGPSHGGARAEEESENEISPPGQNSTAFIDPAAAANARNVKVERPHARFRREVSHLSA